MTVRELSLPRLSLRLETARWVAAGTVAAVGFLALYPTAMLFYGSLSDAPLGVLGRWTLAHYRQAYADPATYRILAASLAFATGATVLSTGLATFLAWVTVRTNAPGRGVFELVALVPNVIPRFLVATSWALILSPRIGLLNQGVLQPLGLPAVNGYSLVGMMFVEGLVLTPLAFLILSAAFRAMDPALEEAGRVAGSGVWDVTRRVTLPVMTPALLGTATLNFARALESLDIPLVLGRPVGIEVLSTKVFREAHTTLPPNHNLAAAYAVGLLAVTLGLVATYRRLTSVAERYVTITGRGYRPQGVDLGRWRYLASAAAIAVLGMLVVVPWAVLLYVSLVPYYHVPTGQTLSQLTLRHYDFLLHSGRVGRAIQVSFTLAFGGATVAMLLATLVAYFTVYRRVRWSGVLESLSFVPWAFPGTALAVGLLWAYAQLPLPIYGTLWILLISYVTRFLPYGLRAMTSTMVQVHRELEDASKVCGASFARTLWRVLLPLLRPGFLAGWAILFTIYIQEFSTSVLLYTPRSEPIGPLLFYLWEDGQVGDMAALGIVVSVMCVAVAAAARGWMRGPGVGP